MAIRKYKPTTPGRRGASGSDFSEVTRSDPEKSLVRPLHSQGGRNVHGHITARHQGGGHKRSYRRVDATCRATVGEVGNSEQGNIKLGKAGRSRWKGRRPTVRGVAMNPVDHPLGGGEG